MSEQRGRIDVSHVTKTYGAVRAVQDLSFTVEPGRVTGFLGPNGAGKTTTMRVLLGLAAPLSGTATIEGQAYVHLANPGTVVGAVLESTSFHPSRTARNHLRVYAAAAGVPDSRADTVLSMVGLTPAGRHAVKGFSMGMRQRLALATALLADPRVLILDEPANGLDPEGIAWLRGFLRHLAHSEGRTVLVSSHVLSEVEQTVDSVVIIARGRLVHEGTLQDLRGERSATVAVRTPAPEKLIAALGPIGATAAPGDDGALRVTGAPAAVVGHAAWQAGVELHELREVSSSLEQLFLDLTGDAPGDGTAPGAAAPGWTG